MTLPPLPFIPSSPEQRIQLIAWGEQIRAMDKDDAERYRWIKARSRCDMELAGVDLRYEVPTENLDAAIDAARARSVE